MVDGGISKAIVVIALFLWRDSNLYWSLKAIISSALAVNFNNYNFSVYRWREYLLINIYAFSSIEHTSIYCSFALIQLLYVLYTPKFLSPSTDNIFSRYSETKLLFQLIFVSQKVIA